MVNASLADPTTTGKCVRNKYFFGQDLLSDTGLSQQFSTAALPSNVTFCSDDKLTSQIIVCILGIGVELQSWTE